MKGSFMDFMEFLNENEAFRKEVVEAASKHGFEFNDEVSDAELESVAGGADAQLANIDLQNTLQKQQQTIQAISSVSKAVHDTAMSIVRKIG